MRDYCSGLLKGALIGVACYVFAIACGKGTTVPNPTPSPSPSPSVEPTPYPSPVPQPTPASCPPLTRWGVRLFLCADAGGALSQDDDGPLPVEGGWCVFDSTPKFANGGPCNAEHNAVCSCSGMDDPRPVSEGGCWRMCEDPRGPAFTVLQNPGAKEVEEGFQFKFAQLVKGRYEIKTCPRSQLVDTEGYPVSVGGSPCDTAQFDVR